MLFAKTLHHLGIKERTTISIMGYNSPEHFIAIMGSFLANCIITEIYITNGPDACHQ
jgi:long-subunit acyl-CoA synthetase (AMP-forming)